MPLLPLLISNAVIKSIRTSCARNCKNNVCHVSLTHKNVLRNYWLSLNVWYSTKITSDNSEIPKNVIENLHSSSSQGENGIIYDKKPFKMKLIPGKVYNWCLCGHSKNQPLCDGSHKNPYIQIKLRPVRFKVTEEKDYWLCNCKQTSNRPFCDGTHKREDIQSKK